MDYITIQLEYKNGAVQTWDYEVSQYIDLDALKNDMSGDFASVRDDVSVMTIKSGISKQYDMPKVKGKSFTNFVFGKIK